MRLIDYVIDDISGIVYEKWWDSGGKITYKEADVSDDELLSFVQNAPYDENK